MDKNLRLTFFAHSVYLQITIDTSFQCATKIPEV